jgi:hypothetical protein
VTSSEGKLDVDVVSSYSSRSILGVEGATAICFTDSANNAMSPRLAAQTAFRGAFETQYERRGQQKAAP